METSDVKTVNYTVNARYPSKRLKEHFVRSEWSQLLAEKVIGKRVSCESFINFLTRCRKTRRLGWGGCPNCKKVRSSGKLCTPGQS